MQVGYARVSTHDQNPAMQTDALKQAGCEKVFEDQASGAGSDRPGLRSALEYVRKGDTLLVWRLDRLGRSLKDLIEIMGGLEKRGVGFRSLQESVDTTTSGGRLIFHVFGALAEFERNLIRERTRAGLAAARARGRKGGRPKALDEKKQELLYRLYDERRYTIREICRVLGISKPTLYAYLEQRRSQPSRA
ncbi:MAG: recombinase family protein [Anaerolineae bacterium]|nr:recombinase family protein [Anaerolineae bacterium]